MSAKLELRMPENSEFQTVEAAMLKPREAKIVWTRGTDSRLVLAECLSLGLVMKFSARIY